MGEARTRNEARRVYCIVCGNERTWSPGRWVARCDACGTSQESTGAEREARPPERDLREEERLASLALDLAAIDARHAANAAYREAAGVVAVVERFAPLVEDLAGSGRVASDAEAVEAVEAVKFAKRAHANAAGAWRALALHGRRERRHVEAVARAYSEAREAWRRVAKLAEPDEAGEDVAQGKLPL